LTLQSLGDSQTAEIKVQPLTLFAFALIFLATSRRGLALSPTCLIRGKVAPLRVMWPQLRQL
jgi:hypothetical protein